MSSQQRQIAPDLGTYSLFVCAAAFSSGAVTLLGGISQTWMEGGVVTGLSFLGRVTLYGVGFMIGAAEAVAISVVARKYECPLRWKVNKLGCLVLGIVLGCITGFSFCLVASVVFFTFPFPHLWDMMTDNRHR